MNNLYRSLISLATVFPLSITFSYLYSDWLLSLLPDVVSHFLEAHLNAQLVFVLCAVVFNYALGQIILIYLGWVATKLDRLPVKLLTQHRYS